MNLEWLQGMPRWAQVLAFFIVAILAFAVKKIVFYMLRSWTRRTALNWDDLAVRVAEFPATLILLAMVAGFAQAVFPLPERWEKIVLLAAKFISVLAFALFVQKLLLAFQRHYVAKQESLRSYSGIMRVLISVAVYTIFLLIFMDTAGISITPLIASLGIGGIAVALALQDTLSNFFSGIYVLVDRPMRVGDYVQLSSGEEGYVDAIGWRSVRVRRLQNNEIIIPNSKVAGSTITNFDLPEKEMAVLIQVGVDYVSDLEKVERVTIEVGRDVMKTVEGGIPEFEPFIRYHTFGDFSVNFTVILRGKDFVSQYLLKHEFVKRLHRRYAQEGITIPFPVRTVQISSRDVPESCG